MNKQQYIWLFFILLATLSAIFAFDFYSQSKWINFVLFSAMTIVCVILAQVLALSFIQKISHEDSRFVVIDQLNKGLSAARNIGISKSTGDLIMFLDTFNKAYKKHP